jgi:hypothetical protein
MNCSFINSQKWQSEGPKCKTVPSRGASRDPGMDIMCFCCRDNGPLQVALVRRRYITPAPLFFLHGGACDRKIRTMYDGVRVIGDLRDVFRIYLIHSGELRDAILYYKSSVFIASMYYHVNDLQSKAHDRRRLNINIVLRSVLKQALQVMH